MVLDVRLEAALGVALRVCNSFPMARKPGYSGRRDWGRTGTQIAGVTGEDSFGAGGMDHGGDREGGVREKRKKRLNKGERCWAIE